uniref:Uncharacterized protein n=1 Tax=Strigamia maritima TaxID=126957 RepID=T1J2W7_STRMM
MPNVSKFDYEVHKHHFRDSICFTTDFSSRLVANKLLTWMTKHYRKYNMPMKIKMDAALASNFRTMRMCEVLCTLRICRAFMPLDDDVDASLALLKFYKEVKEESKSEAKMYRAELLELHVVLEDVPRRLKRKLIKSDYGNLAVDKTRDITANHARHHGTENDETMAMSELQRREVLIRQHRVPDDTSLHSEKHLFSSLHSVRLPFDHDARRCFAGRTIERDFTWFSRL